MPTFEICCVATLEIIATIEDEDSDAAHALADELTVVNYTNNTVGAETHDGEVNQVIGHEVHQVQYVTEVE